MLQRISVKAECEEKSLHLLGCEPTTTRSCQPERPQCIENNEALGLVYQKWGKVAILVTELVVRTNSANELVFHFGQVLPPRA